MFHKHFTAEHLVGTIWVLLLDNGCTFVSFGSSTVKALGFLDLATKLSNVVFISLAPDADKSPPSKIPNQVFGWKAELEDTNQGCGNH